MMSSWGEAAAEGKAVLAEAAAVLNDNSKATDIFISGVQGVNSAINGLYSPTEETGQDGRILYRKSDEFEFDLEEYYIEHYEEEWRVYCDDQLLSIVRGGCALEDCRSRKWKVFNGQEFVHQPSVKIVIGQRAKSMASGNCILAPECTRSLLSIFVRAHANSCAG